MPLGNATSGAFVFLFLHILWRSVWGNYDWLPYVYHIYMYCVGRALEGWEKQAPSSPQQYFYISCHLMNQITSLRESNQLLAQRGLCARSGSDLVASSTVF